MATGILSKPPKAAASKPKAQNSKPKKNAKAQAPAADPLRGLSDRQKQGVNQRQDVDNQLGATAAGMMPGVQSAYQNPFDWSQLPSSPVQGDFNAWRDQQVQQGNQAFDARMNPVFQQQGQDFEQQMANRGIPIGSELYNREKNRMEQSQNDARQQGYFQAAQTAGQNAEQFFNVGTQARGNALSEGLTKRNMPLNEMNALYAAQSPMNMQNLGYAQNLGSQNNQAANQLYVNKNSPRGGGGGGGADPYMGFGTAQNLWSAQDARSRANAEYQMQLQQKYAPKSPSYGAQLGGQLLGGAIGLGIGLL